MFTTRHNPRANAFTSLGCSTESYQPMYAAPTGPPRAQMQQTGSALLTPRIPAQLVDQHTTMVNREPRMMGIRWLYSRGGQCKPWFRMIATGQVESTKFQPVLAHQWAGEFNDSIYQAGYPRNLGYTFKVDQPVNTYTTPGPSMASKPWIRRPYYARRAYTSGIAGVPAESTYPPKRGQRM